MAEIDLVIKDISSVPEGLRDFYKEQDGMFVLQGKPYKTDSMHIAVQDIRGLQTSIESERATSKDWKQKATAAESEVSTLRDEVKTLKDSGSGSGSGTSKQIEARLAEQKDALTKAHQAELAKITGERDSAISGLETLQLRDAAIAALNKHNALTELALPHVLPLLKLEKTDTGYESRVMNKQGVPRSSARQGQAYMDPDELVEEMAGQDAFAPLFRGSEASGSGSSGSSASANGSGGDGSGAVKRIPSSNQAMINAHAEDIASGKAIVVAG